MRRTYLVLLLIAGYNLTVSYQNPFSIKHIKGTFVTVSKDTTQIFFTPVIADSIPEGVLLDEVVLTGSNHEFDSALYNQELNQQLQWDIINNPYAYEKNIPSGNLFALLGLAIKLFERRKPSLKKGLIKDSDLETLYQEEDNFLNDSFFKEVLRIPIVERQLFFKFVESKDLEADFLQEENHFLLIDNLLNQSLIYNMQYIENK